MSTIRDNNSTDSTSSTQAVLDVLVPGVELTDAEIVDRIPHLHRGKVIPARLWLARQGEVELVGQNSAGRQIWRRTPPERREEAKQAAAARKLTDAARLAKRKPEHQAQVIAALLENPKVNRILREQAERGRAMRRARGRAQEAHIESEADKRERKRELREAERQKAANLEFLKVRDRLRDSVDALLGIRSFLQEELERHHRGEPMKIPPERWSAAAQNVREVFEVTSVIWHEVGEAMDEIPTHCPLCGARTARDPRALDEGYFDAEVEEEVVEAEIVE